MFYISGKLWCLFLFHNNSYYSLPENEHSSVSDHFSILLTVEVSRPFWKQYNYFFFRKSEHLRIAQILVAISVTGISVVSCYCLQGNTSDTVVIVSYTISQFFFRYGNDFRSHICNGRSIKQRANWKASSKFWRAFQHWRVKIGAPGYGCCLKYRGWHYNKANFTFLSLQIIVRITTTCPNLLRRRHQHYLPVCLL